MSYIICLQNQKTYYVVVSSCSCLFLSVHCNVSFEGKEMLLELI